MTTRKFLAEEEEGIPLGWMTPALHNLAFWATYPRRVCIGDHLLTDHSEASVLAESSRRAWRADTFLAVCLLIDVLAIALIGAFRTAGIWVAVPYLAWRIADVVFTALHATLFGEFLRANQSIVKLAPSRVVTLGLLSYLELAVCFGGIYACWPELIKAEEKDFLTPFHLRFITQLTIGYGDASPLGKLRAVTWVQGMCSIVVMVFLIAKYLGELRRS
jgi:hypothetical protein